MHQLSSPWHICDDVLPRLSDKSAGGGAKDPNQVRLEPCPWDEGLARWRGVLFGRGSGWGLVRDGGFMFRKRVHGASADRGECLGFELAEESAWAVNWRNKVYGIGVYPVYEQIKGPCWLNEISYNPSTPQKITWIFSMYNLSLFLYNAAAVTLQESGVIFFSVPTFIQLNRSIRNLPFNKKMHDI